ncbi:hypothetical protein [Maribacter sp. 2304DJ31-5]|uniref:hypothetical protein n=1 Tax=Maribacter sp. 2304DJ31-5 TaxID=3386273 RepID=UPI0039BD1B7E
MKKIIGLIGAALFVMVMLFNIDQNNIDTGDISFSSLLAMNTSSAEDGGSFKGPLCSNASGTIYCCKDSDSSSCAAGAKCSSCQ